MTVNVLLLVTRIEHRTEETKENSQLHLQFDKQRI